MTKEQLAKPYEEQMIALYGGYYYALFVIGRDNEAFCKAMEFSPAKPLAAIPILDLEGKTIMTKEQFANLSKEQMIEMCEAYSSALIEIGKNNEAFSRAMRKPDVSPSEPNRWYQEYVASMRKLETSVGDVLLADTGNQTAN